MSVLFSPSPIGRLLLKNRLIMSPMQQYQGTAEACATDYHVHHYARRARGGVALVITESTAVSPNGRLVRDDIGIFSDAHGPSLTRIVDAVHVEGAPIFVQLSHGGRKSISYRGSRPLAPSAVPYSDAYDPPLEMTPADIHQVIAEFASAARRAVSFGFDGVEVHAAHGYLLHQFLSPVANRRVDLYGADAEGRGRLLREVFAAVREEVGPDYPVIVRVSASDFVEGGLTPEIVANALKPLLRHGLDAVDVSGGAILPIPPREIGPAYQVPFARTIRAALQIPVIAVGLIRGYALAEQILAEGSADFIAMGRPLLEDPDHVLKLKAAGAPLPRPSLMRPGSEDVNVDGC